MTDLILRHLATDRRTLALYLCGERPSSEKVRSNLFLAERECDHARPDHVYRNVDVDCFRACRGLNDLLNITFSRLIAEKIEWRGARLHVKLSSLQNWHDLITVFPPLPLVSFAIWNEVGAPSGDVSQFEQFTERYIAPNVGATALLSPFHPVLAGLVSEPGLYDLHQHLNGTSEADVVWLETLERPLEFYQNARRGWESSEVREHYSQLEIGLTPQSLYDRVRLAAFVRERLVAQLTGLSVNWADVFATAVLSRHPFMRNQHRQLRSHPIGRRVRNLSAYTPLSQEALFHVLAHRWLQLEPGDSFFAAAYHLYLLLYGSFSVFLVQQHEQFGFDQFQRITENEFRSGVEGEYTRRFYQVAGNGGTCPKLIEGRFAPKRNVSENFRLLENIRLGHEDFAKSRNGGSVCAISQIAEVPQLSLVAHFIKKQDKKTDSFLSVRHNQLRSDLDRQGRSLLTTIRENSKLRPLVAGVDAASNELHAPPEVFAPIYRKFRRAGFTNFTFHVGEDFVHLLSGLRRIWEAAIFLDLRTGNRVGHATAVGIEPDLWIRSIGMPVTILTEEWLDDLLFAFDILKDSTEGQPYLERLRYEIERLATDIYGVGVGSIHSLSDAWKMRWIDPRLTYGGFHSKIRSLNKADIEEMKSVERVQHRSPEAYALFMQYQRFPKRIQQKMEIVGDVLVDKNLLQIVQLAVLRMLNLRGIVIETMPTSNVRISMYKQHSEHHIWRWLNNNGDTMPTVCVASDDPGIFSTSLYNEYAHLLRSMLQDQGLSLDDASAKLQRLAENGRRYRFIPNSI
jgi:adenosine deaminase